jgi:hypothetical protein
MGSSTSVNQPNNVNDNQLYQTTIPGCNASRTQYNNPSTGGVDTTNSSHNGNQGWFGPGAKGGLPLLDAGHYIGTGQARTGYAYKGKSTGVQDLRTVSGQHQNGYVTDPAGVQHLGSQHEQQHQDGYVARNPITDPAGVQHLGSQYQRQRQNRYINDPAGVQHLGNIRMGIFLILLGCNT